LPDTARDEARRLLGDVASGEDPAGAKQAIRKAITVGELCDRYMADAKAGLVLTRFGAGKKASTLAIDEGRTARHIKPVLGSLAVAAVTAGDVRNLRDAVAGGKTACRVKTGHRGLARVRGGKGAATRVLRLLGGIFTFAVAHGMRVDNPVRGVPQFRDGQRERRLSKSEYRALGKALHQADKSAWPPAVAAARFLALTGWRSGEPKFEMVGDRSCRAHCRAARHKNRPVNEAAFQRCLRRAAQAATRRRSRIPVVSRRRTDAKVSKALDAHHQACALVRRLAAHPSA